MQRKAVAIDFDGTIAYTDYPTIISANREALAFIGKCRRLGVAVILWTCRTGHHLEEALEWCYKQGIAFDAINENLDDWKDEFYKKFPSVPPNSRKVCADIYIDDRANNGVIDWKELDKAIDWLVKAN